MESSLTSTRRVLLGLFVVGQLVFLSSMNLFGLIRSANLNWTEGTKTSIQHVAPGFSWKKGRFWDLTNAAYQLDVNYAQLTGQWQVWSLFAPNVATEIQFPAVLTLWEEESLSAPPLGRAIAPLMANGALDVPLLAHYSTLPSGRIREPLKFLSFNEPADIHSYFRLGDFRLRRYESELISLRLVERENEDDDTRTERWRIEIRDHVEQNRSAIRAYFRWRLAKEGLHFPTAEGESPDALPRQIILTSRQYRIKPPSEAPPTWSDREEHFIARWQPYLTWQDQRSQIEAYNPVTESFEGPGK